MSARHSSSGSRPRRVDKAVLIRQAAFRCFNERGYDETTVDDVCRTAGVSKGSFYWHFKSKQQVFLSILENWAAEVEEQLSRRFESAPDAAEPLEAVADTLRGEARRAQLIMPVWLDFLSRVRREPEIRAGLADFHQRIRTAIALLLEPLLGSRFNADELHSIAGTLLGTYLGLIGQFLADPSESSFDDPLRVFVPIVRSYLEPLQQAALAVGAQDVGVTEGE